MMQRPIARTSIPLHDAVTYCSYMSSLSLIHTCTVDEVTLEQGEYSVREEDEVLSVQLFRLGDLSRTTSVLLRSRTLNTPNAAQGIDCHSFCLLLPPFLTPSPSRPLFSLPSTVEIDYSEFSEIITFEPQQSIVQVNVILSEDDVFPEPDKVFELFLSPSEGVFITPFAAATVTIINQDPDLPGQVSAPDSSKYHLFTLFSEQKCF